MVNLQNLSEDEQYFAARVSDAFQAVDARNCSKLVGFLDEKQQEIARQCASQHHWSNYLLYGGYDGASRRMLGVFPDFIDLTQDPDELFDCLDAITARFRPEDALTHRDFLGALMGLGITRDAVGDILVGDGLAVLFVKRPVTKIILDELSKVGRAGVRCECGRPGVLPVSERFLDIRDTVSSLRLDGVVSVLTRLSREKAAALIKQGLVTQNFACVQSGSHPVAQGDQITVRGYGKFVVHEVGGTTKKGRIALLCKKYL